MAQGSLLQPADMELPATGTALKPAMPMNSTPLLDLEGSATRVFDDCVW